NFQMTRTGPSVGGRLRITTTYAPTKAKKRLIATVPSSEIELNNGTHNHLTVSNSNSRRCFSKTSPHLQGSRNAKKNPWPPAVWRLLATLTKAGFELNNCNQRRSHFSTRNKFAVS